jgi:hypothetical protein
MHHESWNLWQDDRNRCLESSRWRQQILIFAKIAYHIHHAQLANTTALVAAGAAAVVTKPSLGRVVDAVPYADEVIVGVFQGGQGVGDGGGDGQGPQGWFAETEVGHHVRQQAHCHAKPSDIIFVDNEISAKKMCCGGGGGGFGK